MSKIDRQKALDLRASDMKYSDIGSYFGVTGEAVRQLLARKPFAKKVKQPEVKREGKDNPDFFKGLSPAQEYANYIDYNHRH